MSKETQLKDLVNEIETAFIERGQSTKVISNYHYIYRVFLAYSKSFEKDYFCQEILERCLREHYGIMDENILSRRQHYKKMVLRAFKILCDHAESKPFASSYTTVSPSLASDEYICAIDAFRNDYQKSGHRLETLNFYQRYSVRFLEYAEQNNVQCLNNISAELISSYTMTLTGYHKCTIKGALGTLRIFFKFLYTHEYIERDLSILVAGVKVRTQTKIPSIWAKEEVLKLLAAIDRANPSGKRDYAIILLVVRLGIRVGDINNLKFENINWRKNSIEFVQSKTQNLTRLPLLKDVGWAIIDYIENGRPKIDSPFVFLTHISPFKQYANGNHLHATIKMYMDVAGIQNQTHQKRGMHSLRYALANRLQENGESRHTISSALGHSSPDSADVYVKTDIELLRECSLSPSEVGI